MPKGIENTSINTEEARASIKVAGSASINASKTGFFIIKENPKFP